MGKSSRFILLIFLVALILRSLLLIVAFKYPQRTIQSDTSSYIRPAEALLAGQGYTFPGDYRTPIYPMFLASFFALFGENLPIIVVAQVIISALSVVLTYLVGILLFPKRLALIGALLLALSLESIIGPFFILTETLFTFLFLGSIYAFLRYRSEKSILWLIISALLMALSILCRPIVIYFPIVVVIWLAVLHWKQWIKIIVRSLVYVAAVFLILAAWFIRNQVVEGAPLLSTVANYDLLFYNVASLDATLHGGNIVEYRASYSLQVQTDLGKKGLLPTDVNLDREYATLAMKKILANPVQFALVQVRDDLQNFLPGWAFVLLILGPKGPHGGIQGTDVLVKGGLSGVFQTYFGGRLWLVFVILPFIILLGAVYISDLAGTIIMLRNKAWFALLVLIIPAAYLLVLPGENSNSRFRMPAMPEMCIIAGIGIDWAYVRLKHYLDSRKVSTIKNLPDP